MTSPRLSVIVPTYRDRGFIPETLASVLRNIAPRDEVLVVANGSDDAYLEKLRLMVAPPVRLIAIETACVSTARNTGLAEATGEFVQFLDDDDILCDGALAALRKSLAENESWFAAVGDVEKFGEGEATRWICHPNGGGAYSSVNIVQACIPSPGAGMIRRDMMLKVGGFNPRFVPAEDYDAWLRLSLKGPIVWQNVPTLRYRLHEGGVSRQAARMALSSIRIFQTHGPEVQQQAGARACFHALRKSYGWFRPKLRNSWTVAWQQRDPVELTRVIKSHLLFGTHLFRLAGVATVDRYASRLGLANRH